MLAIFSAVMIAKVNIVMDMAEYLPDDSSMRKGMAVIESEFPDMETGNIIRVMFQELPQEKKETLKADLEKISYVDSVDYELDSEDYNKDGMKEVLDTAYTEIKDGEKQLRGENCSLMLVSTNLSEESEETNDFLADVNEKCEDSFSGEFYMIGNSPIFSS